MNIIKREGKWRLFDRHDTLLLTDEKTLDRIIQNPANTLVEEDERGYSGEKKEFYPKGTSLVTICERAKNNKARRLEVSYDFFFGGSVRTNYPSSPKTIEAYKAIYGVARGYGLDFSASVVSPLDIGGGYVLERDSSYGTQMQFKECAINGDGEFSADMVLQTQWTNNKGPIKLTVEKVLAFAFNETRIDGTPYFYVDENSIEDVSACAKINIDEGSVRVTGVGYGSGKATVSGAARTDKSRLLAVIVYKTPEMDYFSREAPEYIKGVIKNHADNGIKYSGFYSDEMHIQFDWDLDNHFGHDTEINTRYVTPGLAEEYAGLYGAKFADFPKYLIYFAYHGHDFIDGEDGKIASQHVLGPGAEGIYATWEFRKRYYEMLQNRVVGICIEAKDYAEGLFGGVILTRAHSTWQEAPTCDHFFPKDSFTNASEQQQCRYDYTREYQWSSSVREDISACYDYFKWNKYLTGGGTDHPEGGFLDRNYYGSAFACSLALLNKFPFSYYGFWGMPDPVRDALAYAGVTYGNECLGSVFMNHNILQGLTPRVSDVLALYPLDLNYVEERYGSWMVQYGYTDYITEDELIAHYKGAHTGSPGGADADSDDTSADLDVADVSDITDDTSADVLLRIGGRSYRAVCVLFSPFISDECLEILREFCERGGKIIWFSAPPLQSEGCVREKWLDTFGVGAYDFEYFGVPADNARVTFSGPLGNVADMKIITGLTPDFIYPIKNGDGASPAASVILPSGNGVNIGSVKTYPGGGLACYVGCRARDDQSGSIEPGVNTLSQILIALGAYGGDSLEAVSRDDGSKYIMNKFPNGAVSVANHCRGIRENWYGSFFRDAEKDAEIMKTIDLAPTDIKLDQKILGNDVEYCGEKLLTYRYDGSELLGFGGFQTRGITICGKRYEFSSAPVDIVWTGLDSGELELGITEAYAVNCSDKAFITLPRDLSGFKTAVCEDSLHSGTGSFAYTASRGQTGVDIDDALRGKWLVFYRQATAS
jgi:hypothetical protein